MAILSCIYDFCPVVALKRESGDGSFFSRPEKTPPSVRCIRWLEKQAFDFASAGAISVEAGFEYGCVVAKIECIGREEAADLMETGVRHLPGSPIDDHESGVVSFWGGFLRNSFCGQVVVEECRIHLRKGVVLFLRLFYLF